MILQFVVLSNCILSVVLLQYANFCSIQCSSGDVIVVSRKCFSGE